MSRSEIGLYVGDTRDLAPYFVYAPSSAMRSAVLSCDSDVIEIHGTRVTALKGGDAVVTVKSAGKAAVIKISVAYRDPAAPIIMADIPIQTFDVGKKPKTVTLTATVDNTVDPDLTVVWTALGKSVKGYTFEFVPPSAGAFDITAAIGDAEATTVVRVYERAMSWATFVGKLDQADGFTPVKFTARAAAVPNNPAAVFDWRVNGVSACNDRTFLFAPDTAGSYSISLEVNGEKTLIDGKSEVVVNAVGKNVPFGRVRFDDADGVYIDFIDGAAVRYISIASPDGKRKVFDSTDAQYSHLFVGNSFKATEHISPCAAETSDLKQYIITIGGDGKRELVFTQLPYVAERYLKTKVLCKNNYISSIDDASAWVRELYACGKTDGECYLADGLTDVVSAVNRAASRLGVVAHTELRGSVLSLSFDKYAYAPTVRQTAERTRAYAEIPHIEYSEDNKRDNDNVFALDRQKDTVEVSSSEQLLYAVLNGVRPVPIANSVALQIYRAAKNVLINIIGRDYTDAQKVHAAYDWLQWNTGNVVHVDGGSGGFLEGVFSAQREGAVTDAGAAKALALLCGIEGIDCSVETTDDGKHYNRVNIDGYAYNVDVYRGKISASELGLNGNAEHTSHRGLLITDERMAELGVNVVSDEAAFDINGSPYSAKHEYDGGLFDYYITAEDTANEAMLTAAVRTAFDGVKLGAFSVPFALGEVIYYNNTFGVEFCTEKLTEPQLSAAVAMLNKAVQSYAAYKFGDGTRFARVSVRPIGNIISVTATTPTSTDR